MIRKLLSIIVPVYNVEKYLQECVESVIQTDMDSVEIILVDDGSTDSSGKMCDEIADKYDCVHCIHKENAGVSKARNDGLAVARGKYVAFVDADDRLSPNGLSAILEWIQKSSADICFMQARKLYPNGTLVDLGDGISSGGIRGKNKEEVFEYLASRPKYPGSACTKLFKRDFLVDNMLIFPVGRTNGEDLAFVMECLLAAGSFDALDMPYYEYRQNRFGSASHTITVEAFRQVSEFVSEFSDRLVKNSKAVNEIADCAMSFVAYEYLVLMMFYEALRKRGDSEIKALRTYLKEKQWVMRYAKSRLGMLGLCCMKMLGFDLTAWIIGIIKGK